ncbi:unnamed protein product [Rhizoctonia solani]|uniref:Uncharacterized protein n=1 Tax=Rhizoctonia solani TaxID=456999 RepID=A0A8H3HBB3_9AGAM|nr:unnamed protein product [Rhizoctonia solani]
MLFRSLLILSTSFCLAMTQVQGAILPREASVACPLGQKFDAMLPLMKCFDHEVDLAKSQIAAFMVSSSNIDPSQVDEAIAVISGKMRCASAYVRKFNWTLVETYAKSADGLRLLLPNEIRPAAQPYFLNIENLMVMIRDYKKIRREHGSHRPRGVEADVGATLFQSGKEYVYGYSSATVGGSGDYVSFASAVNFTGELHIQGGASVLNVQLNNVQLGFYNGEWGTQSVEATRKITTLNSTLASP